MVSKDNMTKTKETWKQIEDRAMALLSDYAFVYYKIQMYILDFQLEIGAMGFDSDTSNELVSEKLLTLFEEGIAKNKPVLEVTGTDVASFCDALLKDTDARIVRLRNELNDGVAEGVGA
jgi:DNA-binding ferritin-like protein (Dps family)